MFKRSMDQRNLLILFLCGLVLSMFFEPALAAGGLEKVNSFMENILDVLRGISIVVVTIAIMWAGYKYLFRRAEIAECAKILGGGLLIGGASELTQYLLGA